MKRAPRMRMFAGPNGSGKSTIIRRFLKEKSIELLGIYINADDIEKSIREHGVFKFDEYHIVISKEEIFNYFHASELLKKADLIDSIALLKIDDSIVLFENETINSYFASELVYIVRHELLKQQKDFTFETVMSSVDKVDFLNEAQSYGYRTYLYYIATDDPIININRVENRYALGGHNVPREKIESRYSRSLSFLKNAIIYSNRAFIFDNSSENPEMIAEVEDKVLEYKVTKVPYWFMKAIGQV